MCLLKYGSRTLHAVLRLACLGIVLLSPAAGAQTELERALREINQGTPSAQTVQKWARSISAASPATYQLSPDEYAATLITLARQLSDESALDILASGLRSLESADPAAGEARLRVLDEIARITEKRGDPGQALATQRTALGLASNIWGEHMTLVPRLRALETLLARVGTPEALDEVARLKQRRERIERDFEKGLRQSGTMGTGEPSAPSNSELVTVHFATNRALAAPDNPGAMFAGYRERSRDELWYGWARVSVPRESQLAGLPEGRYWIGELSRSRYSGTVIVDARLDSGKDGFLASVRSALANSSREELLVFIHGYANDWPSAVRRTAALSVSLGLDGAPVLLSWPSRGDPLSYLADTNEVTAAISRQFGAVLDALLASSGAKRVTLIAHSMGSRFAMNALENMRVDKAPATPLRLVFASPDIDAADFQDRVRRLDTPHSSITLYASRADRALALSQHLHQGPRAGDASSRIVAPGLEVVDTTAAKGGPWGLDGLVKHTDFERAALDDLRALVWHGLPAEQRCVLAPASATNARIPWQLISPARCRPTTFRFAIHSARQIGIEPARQLVEQERKSACPAAAEDCGLWSETARILGQLALRP